MERGTFWPLAVGMLLGGLVGHHLGGLALLLAGVLLVGRLAANLSEGRHHAAAR